MKKNHLNLIVFSLCLIIVAINTFHLLKQALLFPKSTSRQFYLLLADAFKSFQQILSQYDIEFLGYYSDKDMEKNTNILIFSQAQYYLAPLVIESGNTDREYVLFDCSSPDVALKKINELGATPIIANSLGMILAKKK